MVLVELQCCVSADSIDSQLWTFLIVYALGKKKHIITIELILKFSSSL